jgi:hypothetical protein
MSLFNPNNITPQKAAFPQILSVSRATDIPAFFLKDFFEELENGFCFRKNPYNKKEYLIRFDKVRFIVFWTKNPEFILPYLPVLQSKNIEFYIQCTLNDYEKENFEPGIPTLGKRIRNFIEISEHIGNEKIIWRFDPLILTKKLSIKELTYRVFSIAEKLQNHTRKLVFSFADIQNYRHIKKNLADNNCSDCREFSENEKTEFAENIGTFIPDFNMQAAACCEDIDLSDFGISRNRCIDGELIHRILKAGNFDFSILENIKFAELLKKKDKSQRKNCLCAPSRDVGNYNTCRFGCLYCYAKR